MSKKDDVKAKVKFFQGFIMLFVATLFAIFGYTATHYKEFDLASRDRRCNRHYPIIYCDLDFCEIIFAIYKEIKEIKMIGIFVLIFAFVACAWSLFYIAYAVGGDLKD
ncbi:hypothetical protein [Helicobacter sp. 23-1045]